MNPCTTAVLAPGVTRVTDLLTSVAWQVMICLRTRPDD